MDCRNNSNVLRTHRAHMRSSDSTTCDDVLNVSSSLFHFDRSSRSCQRRLIRFTCTLVVNVACVHALSPPLLRMYFILNHFLQSVESVVRRNYTGFDFDFLLLLVFRCFYLLAHRDTDSSSLSRSFIVRDGAQYVAHSVVVVGDFGFFVDDIDFVGFDRRCFRTNRGSAMVRIVASRCHGL